MAARTDKVERLTRAARNRPHRQSVFLVGARPAPRIRQVFQPIGHAIAGAVKACVRWSLRRRLDHIRYQRRHLEMQRASFKLAEIIAEEMEEEVLLALRGLDSPPPAPFNAPPSDWVSCRLVEPPEQRSAPDLLIVARDQ